MPQDIQSLLSMLQGQGQGQPQGSPLSGQAFPTPLSGLPFGEQGMGLSGGGGGLVWELWVPVGMWAVRTNSSNPTSRSRTLYGVGGRPLGAELMLHQVFKPSKAADQPLTSWATSPQSLPRCLRVEAGSRQNWAG